MTKDKLFLLAPSFDDNGRKEYCPECAEIWGLLSYFPELQDKIEVDYQPIQKPRVDLVSLFGDKNQNCPTLLFAERPKDFYNLNLKSVGTHYYLDNARDIGAYFALEYGTAFPRGT